MMLLDVRDLAVYFYTDDGVIRAVDHVDFSVEPGKVLGIVGESGSGKSVTALSILGLVPPPGKVISGSVYFKGEDLFGFSEARMRKVRGNQISMVFQDPMTSLNPVFTIGEQVAESLRVHKNLSSRAAKRKAVEMLDLVRIPNAAARVDHYPHQLSGGMRQRVMIAMALSCGPSLLIADEPTTALDVTVQAQILELLKDLQTRFSMSIVLITHNLGIVARTCDDVLVMYAGRAVEKASTRAIFKNPRHPYTIGLLNSIPRLDDAPGKRLVAIPGQLPTLKEAPHACTFVPRCKLSQERCREAEPSLLHVEQGHESRCFFWDQTERLK